jgi:small-conductance mechanosensitive channel
MINWLINNWQNIAIPIVAFLASCIVGLGLRRIVERFLKRWETRTKWEGKLAVRILIQRPILFWFLLLGIAIGIQVSILPADAKLILNRVTGSFFILSLVWVIIAFCERLLKLYLPKIKMQRGSIIAVINIMRITIIIIFVLVILQIWGIPSTPILLIVAVAVLAVAFALRNAASNFFASIQVNTEQQIKTGDYINLGTGEEGYITKMNWNSTYLRMLDNKVLVVPNRLLLRYKITNYGQPLRKALEPFRFLSRTHLTELTCLEAKNLREFVDIIKNVPDSVIYYHTHHFLEEHHYLTPEPSNDFAIWITDTLGDEILGERIASVNTIEFATLGALRERFVGIIEEYLTQSGSSREAMTGREFHFMKSVSFILPTPYYAHDLREFIETLRKISVGSLYFHVFESRIKLGNGLNDFSLWMRDSLGEDKLAEKIARFDPFTYTLEGLRLALIQLIEKRIQ